MGRPPTATGGHDIRNEDRRLTVRWRSRSCGRAGGGRPAGAGLALGLMCSEKCGEVRQRGVDVGFWGQAPQAWSLWMSGSPRSFLLWARSAG